MHRSGDAPFSLELRAGNVLVPLQGMNVVLNVEQYVAQVEVVTRFVNSWVNPLEAVFKFQQEETSIHEFKVEIGDKVLVSVCKEKGEAEEKYDDAIASGHGAYMLIKEKDDIFKLNVGNLPPKAECIISIKYVTLLGTLGDALKLSIPITKVPMKDFKASERFPHIVSVTGNINMAFPITGLESQNHEIHYEINGTSATLSTEGYFTTNEFVLHIGVEDLHKKPSAILEVFESIEEEKKKEDEKTSNQSSTLMVSFYPGNDNIFQDEGDDVLMEYIFVVDRSGSMSGSKTEQLINALQLFLRSIPVGSLFNIVGFGSHYELLFQNSVEYDDQTFAKATNHAANLKADLGGTKLLEPLTYILKQPLHDKFPRQIIILTDGQVGNEELVISFVRRNTENTRIFTLGIGSDASKRLVKGLAKAGKGTAELVADDERMEPKVLAQLRRAAQPYLNVTMDWGSLAESVTQSPTNIPPIFPGDPIVVFGMLSRGLTPSADHVTMKLTNANGLAIYKRISVNASRVSHGKMFGVLAASTYAREIEKKLDEKKIDEKHAKLLTVPLALKYSLVTRFTSLLAEELRTEPVEGTLQIHEFGKTDVDSTAQSDHVINHFLARVQSTSDRSERFEDLIAKSDDLSYQSKFFLNKAESLSVGSSISNALGSITASAGSALSSLLFPKMYGAAPRNNLYDSDSIPPTCSISTEPKSSTPSSSSWFGGFFAKFSTPPPPTSSPLPPSPPSSSLPSSSLPPSSLPHASLPTSPLTPAPTISSTTTTTSSFSFQDSSNKRLLDKLVVLQTASGNWCLTESLLEIAKLTREQLAPLFADIEKREKEDKGKEGDREEKGEKGWMEEVIATVLALALLEVKFSMNVDEWSMLSGKAVKWVRKILRANNSSETAEDLVQKAKALLSSL